MFDELNTEGYTPEQLVQMNLELSEELGKFTDGYMNYQDYYKYASEKVLKRWC